MTLEQDAKIGIEENDLVAVRKDILQFWSSYSRGASEEIISRRSLCVMVHYMYSGKLPQSGNRQERDEDLIAADYLGIDRLTCHSATI